MNANNDEVKQHWISVDDRMPEDMQQVDVLINGKRRVVDVTYEMKKFFAFPPICKEQWTEIKSNVTHWMPLPAPPTQGDKS